MLSQGLVGRGRSTGILLVRIIFDQHLQTRPNARVELRRRTRDPCAWLEWSAPSSAATIRWVAARRLSLERAPSGHHLLARMQTSRGTIRGFCRFDRSLELQARIRRQLRDPIGQHVMSFVQLLVARLVRPQVPLASGSFSRLRDRRSDDLWDSLVGTLHLRQLRQKLGKVKVYEHLEAGASRARVSGDDFEPSGVEPPHRVRDHRIEASPMLL